MNKPTKQIQDSVERFEDAINSFSANEPFNTVEALVGQYSSAVAHDGKQYIVVVNGAKAGQFKCPSLAINCLTSVGALTYKRACAMVLDTRKAINGSK